MPWRFPKPQLLRRECAAPKLRQLTLVIILTIANTLESPVSRYYATSQRVLRGVRYGPRSRQNLDIYLPEHWPMSHIPLWLKMASGSVVHGLAWPLAFMASVALMAYVAFMASVGYGQGSK